MSTQNGARVEHALGAEESAIFETSISVFPFNKTFADTASDESLQRPHHNVGMWDVTSYWKDN